ncbi:hypothetical protein CG395_00130 [Bifidobacteriaceae bacterium GH022]|nr:hypothetical protein CG395_00130 [Bifidobacteriaceae bacterium GH022]
MFLQIWRVLTLFVVDFGVLSYKVRKCFPLLYQIWPKLRTKCGKAGQDVRALQRANVFAARKVHWTLRLSGSAL